MKTILALALVSVACTGGGGPIVDPPDKERPTSTIEGSNESNEPSSPTNENAARSNERPAGRAQAPAGPTAFACTGKFLCRTTGEDGTTNVTLSDKNGICSAGDFTLRGDQQLLEKGDAVGTWSFANDTLTASAGNATITCTKTAD